MEHRRSNHKHRQRKNPKKETTVSCRYTHQESGNEEGPYHTDTVYESWEVFTLRSPRFCRKSIVSAHPLISDHLATYPSPDFGNNAYQLVNASGETRSRTAYFSTPGERRNRVNNSTASKSQSTSHRCLYHGVKPSPIYR